MNKLLHRGIQLANKKKDIFIRYILSETIIYNLIKSSISTFFIKEFYFFVCDSTFFVWHSL